MNLINSKTRYTYLNVKKRSLFGMEQDFHVGFYKVCTNFVSELIYFCVIVQDLSN